MNRRPPRRPASPSRLARCSYCLGFFQTRRSHAETCSAACRQAVCRALEGEDVVTPSLREDHWSKERADATGWGTVTATEAWQADLRVRFAAGLLEPDAPKLPFHGPGYSPDDIRAEWMLTSRRAA